MKNTVSEKYHDLTVMENRVRYLLGSRLKNTDKINAAIEKQDELRNKHTSSSSWDSVSEIRKWRDNR